MAGRPGAALRAPPAVLAPPPELPAELYPGGAPGADTHPGCHSQSPSWLQTGKYVTQSSRAGQMSAHVQARVWRPAVPGQQFVKMPCAPPLRTCEVGCVEHRCEGVGGDVEQRRGGVGQAEQGQGQVGGLDKVSPAAGIMRQGVGVSCGQAGSKAAVLGAGVVSSEAGGRAQAPNSSVGGSASG